MALFYAGSHFGLKILTGNLSSSKILGLLPMADPVAVIQIFAATGSIAPDILIGAAIAVGFYLVVGGRSFCGWVCPVNIITDFARWLRNRLGLPDPYSISRMVRIWFFFAIIVLSALFGITIFEYVSPISMLHRGIIYGIGAGWIVLVALFLFDLFVIKDGWCGHLCPVGAFWSFVGRFSLIKIKLKGKYDPDKLKNAIKICPEPEVLSPSSFKNGRMISGNCINCGRCVQLSDKLGFSFKKSKNSEGGNL